MMDDNYIIRNYVLEKTKDCLQEKWVHYGLEIVELADTISKNIDNISDLDGYIAKSIYNVVLKRKIEESKRKVVSIDDIGLGYESKYNVTSYIDENRIFMQRFLEKALSQSDLEIYTLRFLKGCTIYSIAEELGLTPRTVYGRLRYIMSVVMEYK